MHVSAVQAPACTLQVCGFHSACMQVFQLPDPWADPAAVGPLQQIKVGVAEQGVGLLRVVREPGAPSGRDQMRLTEIIESGHGRVCLTAGEVYLQEAIKQACGAWGGLAVQLVCFRLRRACTLASLHLVRVLQA